MLNTILTKIIGTKNEREIKAHPAPRPADRRAGSPTALADRRCLAGEDGGVPAAPGERRRAWTACCPRPSRSCARRAAACWTCGTSTCSSSAASPCTAGTIAEMKTGEGKTLVATLARLPERARRQGRARGHGQRLPGQARQRVDGPDLPLPGPLRRRHPAPPERPGAPGRVRRRHHLRHQQRVRLRLPARQHEVRPGQLRPARPPLRDRGRGRLDPDRRGAHAAHHQRARPRSRPTSTTGSTGSSPSSSRARASPATARPRSGPSSRRPGDYIVDEKAKTVTLTEMGMAHVEKLLSVSNLWDPSNMDVLHHVNQGAARAHALPARRRLRGQRRPGRDRRRVHRPPDARPALVGRPAPGGRGEGEGQDRAREPDARDDHLPELLPHVREARGHDRYRRDRGPRVRQDLQARGAGDPHQPAAHPRREPRRRLPDRAREVRGGGQGDRGAQPTRTPGAGRHHLDREVRAPLDRCSRSTASSTSC